MCYYNGIKIPVREFIMLKDYEIAITNRELVNRPLVSGFDYSLYPVLKSVHENEIVLDSMEWGFLPAYIDTREKAKKFRLGYKKDNGMWQAPYLTLNAKGEELLEPNKIFRDAALHRRCLVLSSGFYEWRHVFPISERTGKPVKTAEKYPYHITLKGKEYFYMAGVWQPWKDKETGEYIETFAVITTAANSLMAQIHNTRLRMPVILSDDLASEWLLGNPDEERIKEIATSQIETNCMEAVSIAKNFRESSDPGLPVAYDKLPPIKIDI